MVMAGASPTRPPWRRHVPDKAPWRRRHELRVLGLLLGVVAAVVVVVVLVVSLLMSYTPLRLSPGMDLSPSLLRFFLKQILYMTKPQLASLILAIAQEDVAEAGAATTRPRGDGGVSSESPASPHPSAAASGVRQRELLPQVRRCKLPRRVPIPVRRRAGCGCASSFLGCGGGASFPDESPS